MLFATSCSNDEFDSTQSGNESVVSLTLEQPTIATRTYSDGLTATTLTYAVYEAGKKTPLITSENQVTFTNRTATVNLRLVTGKSYDLLFWADAEEAPYTFDATAQTITVDDNLTSQDENRDAFFAAEKSLLVDGAINKTITLRRPFAQLNIGTTDATESATAAFTPTQSEVTVKNVYNTLNLFDGGVSGETELTYAMANIPGDAETFPVAGVKYLSMNYLLVASEKDLVTVDFTVTDGSHSIDREYTSVPVRRNYRTNIYGNILTDATDFNIVIKPEYEGETDVYISTKASFEEDLQKISASTLTDATIILEEDVEINTLGHNGDSYLLTRAGVNLTIEADGHTITAVGEGISSVGASENGSLTIKNATIVDNSVSYAENSWEMGYLELGGKLVLEKCNIVNAIMFRGSSLVVDDCTFNSNKDSEYALWINNGTAEVKNSLFTGSRGVKICDMYTTDVTSAVIDNCTFLNLTKKPGVAIDENIGTTMAVTIKNSTFENTQAGDQGNYIYETDDVVPTLENNKVVKTIASAEELASATLVDGSYVALPEGNFSIPSSVNGKTITFVGSGDPAKTVINPHGGFAGSTLAFENVTLAVAENASYTGSQSIAGASYKDCIINGQIFLYAESYFENCKFNNTGDNYNVWTYGSAKATFVDCEFNCDAKAVLIYIEGAFTAEHTFDNCTFNDSEKLDEAKAAIEIGESAYGNQANYTVNINKCTVNGFAQTKQNASTFGGTDLGTNVWGNKNLIPADRLNIVIDGTEVY